MFDHVGGLKCGEECVIEKLLNLILDHQQAEYWHPAVGRIYDFV